MNFVKIRSFKVAKNMTFVLIFFDAPVPTTGTSRNKLKHVEPIRVQNFDRKLKKKSMVNEVLA